MFLDEASLYSMPFKLHRFFATMAFCTPNDPKLLRDEFKGLICKDHMLDGLLLVSTELRALQNIKIISETMEKDINDYGLVGYHVGLKLQESVAKVIDEESEIDVCDDDICCVVNLNIG